MGESMAGEQSEEPGDGTPKIFKSMTGWIGGATAVVVALGGLYTAYDQLISKPKRAAEESIRSEDSTSGPAAPGTQSAAALSQEKVRNSYTTGDGGTLEWVSGMWVWTDGEGNAYRYSEETNDGVTIVGKMLENGQYVWLQWPVGGGEALQSFDNQDHWEKPIRVTVEKPETTDG